MDSQDNIWVGDYFGGTLTRFDPKTKTFKSFKIPGPMPTPYGEKHTRDLFEDAQGRIWYGAQPYFKVGYVHLRASSGGPMAQNR